MAETNRRDGKTSILIVDDEMDIRQTYAQLLNRHGYDTECASNGWNALQLLMIREFDALIVDIRMDEMDGLVFLTEALSIWPWLGIVIVSGFLTPDIRQRARALGVTSLLSKPQSVSALIAAIETELGQGRHRAERRGKDARLLLMRSHLGLLSRIESTTVNEKTLMTAMVELGNACSELFAANAIGLLMESAPNSIMVINCISPLSGETAREAQSSMLARYATLSGRGVNLDGFTVHYEGCALEPQGEAQLGSVLSVPVIVEKNVMGLLALCATRKDAFTASDATLLYHAAHHVAALFSAMNRMGRLARHDPLTGLRNRSGLEEELQRLWNDCASRNRPISVVAIDIDRFKSVNDAYGHDAGDTVLREFAHFLLSAVRDGDMVARFGGDEFVVALPGATGAAAVTFAQRVQDDIRKAVFAAGRHSLQVTASQGVAGSDNLSRPADFGILLRLADRALYAAKRAGRNRIRAWPLQFSTTSKLPLPPHSMELPDEPPPLNRAQTRAMIVDNDGEMLSTLAAMLQGLGCNVSAFGNGTDAIAAVRAGDCNADLALIDIKLDDMCGLDLVRGLLEADDTLVVLVVTGHASLDNAVASLRLGAYDFIQKPVSLQELKPRIDRALEYRHLKIENASYQQHLEEMIEQRSAQLTKSLDEFKSSYEFTLEALVAMLDAREHHTSMHSFRVRDLVKVLAEEMGIRGEALSALSDGALLHDIGKIGLPDSLLLGAGSLSSEDLIDMRRHPSTGHAILSSSPHLKDAAQIVRSHHERFDGLGYPDGLKGDAICLGARIFAVADAYDAMRHGRAYADRISPEAAADEIRRHSGTQFDPDVVQAFLACQHKLEAVLRRAYGNR